jgi:hypothetical protein
MEGKDREMHGRGQTTETMLQLIDEVTTCLANIKATAKSLEVKLESDGKSSLKADVERIIHVARSTAEKLTCLSRTCTGATQGEPHAFGDETLPGFAEYVRQRHGVEMEEDLVTMIEDLIERQKQKVKA